MRPKTLAAAAPLLAPLAALDVPLTVSAAADLGSDLLPRQVHLDAKAGSGRLVTGDGSIPIHGAALSIAGTPEQATIETGIVELQPATGAAISTVTVGGLLSRQPGRLGAALHVTLDHAGFADLPALWPEGVATDARTWIIQNIQAGTAHDGKLDLELATPDTTPDVTRVSATGTLEGDGLAVTWMPKVPRVEQIKAHLVLPDADKVEIDVRSAHQLVNGGRSDRDPVRSRHDYRAVARKTSSPPSNAMRTGRSPAPSRCCGIPR